MTAKQDYTAELNKIAARYGKLEDETINKIWKLLDDTRARVNQLMLQTDGSSWLLQQRKRAIEDTISEFEATAAMMLGQSVTGAYTFGGQSVTEPLQKLGFQNTFFRPSQSQLNSIIDFTADLITGITAPIRQDVNRQIQQLVLGQTTPFEAMQKLTQEFGDHGVKQGKFVASGVSAKAEMDIRTELQRVYNLSNHAQQLRTQEDVPGLLKTWIATADNRTRKGHLRAHRDYRENPIPVNEPFKVYDISPSGAVKGHAFLMYPADPTAPPQYSINCRCRMATIHPLVGVIGSSLDGRVAQMLEQ